MQQGKQGGDERCLSRVVKTMMHFARNNSMHFLRVNPSYFFLLSFL